MPAGGTKVYDQNSCYTWNSYSRTTNGHIRDSGPGEAGSSDTSGAAVTAPAPARPLPAVSSELVIELSTLPTLFPAASRLLPAEVLQNLLSYLISGDLAGLFVTSKAACSPGANTIVESTVASLVKYRYGRANPTLREDDPAWRRDIDSLRHAELSHLSSLVRAVAQKPAKGYYLSKSWAGNLRRYVEAQARKRRHSPSSASTPSSFAGKGRRRGRERAESNLMPPWEDVNADITCQHGGLAHTSQASRGKREIVDRRVWKELVCFFPAAVPFRAESSECLECLGECADEKRAEEAVKREREHQIAFPALKALFGRKNGVPSASMSTALQDVAGGVIPGALSCPLLPGIYHLLPRCWLNAWRAYVRDPRAPSPRPLDTGLLLCEGHGLLLAPPHVEEFLSGERRALLGGLDRDRSGCVCEILTPEEWDALTLLHPCDLGVRFSVQPDTGEINFNSKKCKSCDPCYIGELYVRSVSRKLSI